jgi:hypothetical protein
MRLEQPSTSLRHAPPQVEAVPKRRSGCAHRLGYALLSSLIPGTGQVLAGYARRGAAMIVVSVLIAIPLLYLAQQGSSAILWYLVQPDYLIAAFVGNVLVLAFRLGAVIDAYRLPGNGSNATEAGWQRPAALAGLLVVIVFTVVPHLYAGYYVYLMYDLLTDMFSMQMTTSTL